jgi:hypothetical protein
VARVDAYVARLVAGDAADPADLYNLRQENAKLKAQFAALNERGFDFIKDGIQDRLKELATAGSGGLTPEQFKKL